MAERLLQEPETSIRFHHLGFLRFVVKEYAKRFNGVMPWELPENVKWQLKPFIFDYVWRELDTDIATREYLEELSSEEKINKWADLGVSDVVGSDVEGYGKVFIKNKEFITRIFGLAVENKDSKILLSVEPDSTCASCAFNKQCKITFWERLFRNNQDFRYRDALERIMKLYEFRSHVQDGGVGMLGKDKFYITAEILFNENFHRLIWLETSKHHQYASAEY